MVETMSDLTELRAAVNAVLENTKLPVFATMTFRDHGKTFIGCSVEEFAEYINDTIEVVCKRFHKMGLV